MSLIFVVLFGGADWGLLISSYLRYRRIRTEAALAVLYPAEPWRQRIEWSANRIKSSEHSTAIGYVCAAVFWNVCSWPMLFAVPEKLKAGEYTGLLFLVFPLLGVGLIYRAIVSIARARRFGQTFLVLDTFPARPGEQVRGHVHAPAALGKSSEAKLALTCERNHRVRNSSGRSGIRTVTVWEQEATSQVLSIQSESGEALLKVDISIPDSLPDSSRESSGEWFTWQLAASAVLDGADFEAEFEVPVFKRSRS